MTEEETEREILHSLFHCLNGGNRQTEATFHRGLRSGVWADVLEPSWLLGGIVNWKGRAAGI